MKKTLLSLFALGFAALSYGQIAITLGGETTDISGTTHHITTTFAQGSSSVLDLEMTNLTGNTEAFVVTRVNLSQPANWENNLCWGVLGQSPQCFPSNPNAVFVSPNTATLANNETALASPHYFAGDLGTSASYRYYFGTVANPNMDSIDVEVHYVLGIKEVKKDLSVSVSPNPASENVLVKATNIEKANLKIVDVLGNVILFENFNGTKNIDVAEYKNGVYFILISGEGMSTINRKLVVRH